MGQAVLISQNVAAIAADEQALPSEAGSQVGNSSIRTALYDGAFSNEDREPKNLFFFLANLHGAPLGNVYFGNSVNSPNPTWTWAIMRWLLESLSSEASLRVPSQARQLLWQSFRTIVPDALSSQEVIPGYYDVHSTQPLESVAAGERAALGYLLQWLDASQPGAMPPNLVPSELIYLFHGGARRGYSLSRAANEALEGRSQLSIVDHGAALGLVSMFWMLLEPRIAATTAVEVAHKYIAPGKQVAQDLVSAGRSFTFANSSMEQFRYDTAPDLVAFVHSLYRVSAEDRARAVALAWDAIPPGGALVLNEILRSAVSKDATYAATVMDFDELVGHLSPLGQALLYTPWDLWEEGEVLEETDPERWTSDHVVVVQKGRNRHVIATALPESSAKGQPEATAASEPYLQTFDLDSFDDELVRNGTALLHEQDLTGVDIHPDVLWRYADLVNSSVLTIAARNTQGRMRRIAMRPYFRVVQDELAALVGYFGSRGYVLAASMDELTAPAPRTCYLRYDLHHRDLGGAYGFLDYHLAFNTPGSFFLEWGASHYTESQESDFLVFAETVQDPVKVGLHASPVDNFLCWEYCEGDVRSYIEFANGPSLMQTLRTILKTDTSREYFEESVFEHYRENVEEFYRLVPQGIRFVSAHGGILSQFFRAKVAELGEIGEFIRSSWAENWHTPTRLDALGLLGDVEQCRALNGVAKVSDRGGKAGQLARNIEAQTKSGHPIQVLMHPRRWFGQRREGRLTTLNESLNAESRPSGQARGPG